jgi:hypothetical protein
VTMSVCQLISFADGPDRVLLDIIPLERLDIDGTSVPRGTPLTMSFIPSEDPAEHREMIGLFDRWTDDDGILDLDVVVTSEVGGFRYVFTHEDEQLVLDVRT